MVHAQSISSRARRHLVPDRRIATAAAGDKACAGKPRRQPSISAAVPLFRKHGR